MATTARPTRVRALTVAAALAAAVGGWVLLGPVAGVDLTVTAGGGRQRIGAVTVTAVTALVGLAGWGLRALLDRVTAHARTAWTVVAAAVLALSLLGPVGGAGGAGTVAALLGLHLLVGAILLLGLRATGRARDPRSDGRRASRRPPASPGPVSPAPVSPGRGPVDSAGTST